MQVRRGEIVARPPPRMTSVPSERVLSNRGRKSVTSFAPNIGSRGLAFASHYVEQLLRDLCDVPEISDPLSTDGL
jgi:hypothetical protein